MKIAVFGARGKTGIEVVKLALDRGHEVTVMVRDPKRLPVFSKPINVLIGDFSDINTVISSVKGQNAVICTLGSRELYKNSGLRTTGTAAIIRAMQQESVQR